MVPVLDFTKEWTDGLEGYSRLFNRSVVFSKLENGKVVPVDNEFERRQRPRARQAGRLIRTTRARLVEVSGSRTPELHEFAAFSDTARPTSSQ